MAFKSNSLFRLIIAAITFLAVFFFMNVFVFSVISLPGKLDSIQKFLSFLVAIAIARIIWGITSSVHAGIASYAVIGAFLLGGIGFIAGFFGPIIFRPDANQGPLLGIFFTGPIGFLVGLIAGGILGIFKKKPNKW